MDISPRQYVITLLIILGLWVFIWWSDSWIRSGGAGLSMLCRMAFCAAVYLYSIDWTRLACEPADAPLLRLRIAAIQGAQWFVIVIILKDIQLPSVGAGVSLASTVGFGLVIGRISKPTEAGTVAAASGFMLYAPLLAWGVTAAFAFLPMHADQGYALFMMILALGVASPGPQSWATLRWQDWAMSALAVAALLTGLFTAP